MVIYKGESEWFVDVNINILVESMHSGQFNEHDTHGATLHSTDPAYEHEIISGHKADRKGLQKDFYRI